MSSTSGTSKAEAVEQHYEVFLNFRGLDTRTGFTDHLYRRLVDANIRAYIDDEELRKGEEIAPKLLHAINRSTIVIPVFSKRYAESKWCLKELVEINNCKRSREIKVMPIFYYVTPFEVRNQTGSFEQAFALHELKYDNTIIRKWKEALSEIGTLSGWEIPSNTYSQEGELVEDVTKEISFALKKAYVKIPDHLVGLGRHVEKILEMLNLETHGVRIIGIYGMGSIGKTTLAKVVYNHLLPKFEGSSFLVHTRYKDIEDLKKDMISSIPLRKSSNYVDKGTIAKRFVDKRVLIVLDDVDEETQIEDLIGKRGQQDWFASGSRLIITTRNEGFLRHVQVDESYELSAMSHVHSLQLFYRHAFESDNPKADHIILSEQIVKTTGGLPLALEVIGSSLCNKSKQIWTNKLEKLKDVPVKDVSQKLRISFDELDERQKHIFLDIACFFIGWDQKIVIHFWDQWKFYPEEAINVLQQKSLIKIHDNLLWMHVQLRDLGKEIVREGIIMEPEKQTRLWDRKEATKIFMTNKETEKIQGIYVEYNDKSYPYFTEEEFSKLSKVRLFWVKGNYFNHLHQPSSTAQSNFHSNKPYIFSELMWLWWPRFPHICIETSNFSLMDLAILDLSYSDFTIDWAGWCRIEMAQNLKVLNLTGCRKLVKTPKFSCHLLLERLILKGCSDLVEIDNSICMQKHLVRLNLKFCDSLRKLPIELSCMESLRELLIDGTYLIDEIPRWPSMIKLEVFSAHSCWRLENCISLNNLTSMKKLVLNATRITLIPDSIGELVNLLELHPNNCNSLKKLPESIGGLVSLIQLDVSRCGIEELPNSIGCLKNLKLLNVSWTPVRELPTTIRMAEKLEEIHAEGCYLCCLPMLPQSLINSTLNLDAMQEIPDLSNLINLKRTGSTVHMNKWGNTLRSRASAQYPCPWWIGRLSKVEKLDLAFPTVTTLHPDLGALSLLTELSLIYCVRLQSVPKLPSNLISFEVAYCESLKSLSDLSHLKKLSTLQIRSTPLSKLEGLHSLESLQILRLRNCHNLVEIHGRLESLESLLIHDCHSMEKIPDIMNVKTLCSLWIHSCPRLCHEEINHSGPVLSNNSSISESERSFMSSMLKICSYSE